MLPDFLKKDLLELFLIERKTLLLLVALITIIKAVQLYPTLLIGKIIDKINGGLIGLSALGVDLTVYAILSIVFLFLFPLQTFLLNNFAQKFVAAESSKWFVNIIKKPFTMFSAYSDVYIYKTLDRGMLALDSLLSLLFLTALPLVAELSVAILYFWWKADLIFIFLLVLLSFLQLALVWGLISWRRSHIEKLNDSEDFLADHVMSLLRSSKMIKLQRSINSVSDISKYPLSDYRYNAVKASVSASLLTGVTFAARHLGTVATLAIGIYIITSTDSALTVGELVINFTLITSFLISIERIAMGYKQLDQFQVDMKNLQLIFDWGDNYSDKFNEKQNITKPLKLEIINNKQPSSKEIVIPSGKKVLVIGSSGSGKTTFIESLLRINSSEDWGLNINGVNTSSMSEEQLFQFIQYIPQTPIIFYGPLHQSIMFETNDKTQIKTHLKKLNLPERILSNNFEIDFHQESISIGEKSRMHFSRFLTGTQPVVILDEPTNALDEVNRKIIWNEILNSGKTLIVISHDLSHLKDFDLIIEIDNQEIIYFGETNKYRV